MWPCPHWCSCLNFQSFITDDPTSNETKPVDRAICHLRLNMGSHEYTSAKIKHEAYIWKLRTNRTSAMLDLVSGQRVRYPACAIPCLSLKRRAAAWGGCGAHYLGGSRCHVPQSGALPCAPLRAYTSPGVSSSEEYGVCCAHWRALASSWLFCCRDVAFWLSRRQRQIWQREIRERKATMPRLAQRERVLKWTQVTPCLMSWAIFRAQSLKNSECP